MRGSVAVGVSRRALLDALWLSQSPPTERDLPGLPMARTVNRSNPTSGNCGVYFVGVKFLPTPWKDQTWNLKASERPSCTVRAN